MEEAWLLHRRFIPGGSVFLVQAIVMPKVVLCYTGYKSARLKALLLAIRPARCPVCSRRRQHAFRARAAKGRRSRENPVKAGGQQHVSPAEA